MFIKPWIISIWHRLDPIYFSFTRLRYVTEKQKNIFRVRLMRYRGKQIKTAEGIVLNRGDLLLKIHLHNVILLKQWTSIQSDIRRARLLHRLVKQSLPDLADYLKNHPRSQDIKGIMGITLISKGCQKLGFSNFPLTGSFYRRYKWLTFLPIHFLSNSTPFKHLKKHQPMYLFMASDQLLNNEKTRS